MNFAVGSDIAGLVMELLLSNVTWMARPIRPAAADIGTRLARNSNPILVTAAADVVAVGAPAARLMIASVLSSAQYVSLARPS
jgi:hypothetical protein